MSNLPYRQVKKPGQYSHGFSRSAAPFWGFLAGLAVLGLFLLWPAFFYHGEHLDTFTGQERWAWDIHSTAACCTWWGILLLAGMIGVLIRANSPQVRGAEKDQLPVPPDFPDLRHLYGNPFLES